MAKKKAAKKAARPRATKKSELDGVICQLETLYRPEGTSALIHPASEHPAYNHIPTGAFNLDFSLLGGIPEGSATMLYGKPSCGKTTLAKRIVAEFQRKVAPLREAGHTVSTVAVWVDTERLFDSGWAAKQGVDIDALRLVQPSHGQMAVDIIAAVVGAAEVGLVVLDSVPACISMNILDKSAEDMTMTELARLMGTLSDKLLGAWNDEAKRGHHFTFVPINQWRTKPGMSFGDPRYRPGGIHIDHLPTTQIGLTNKEHMGEDQWGNEVVEYNEHEFHATKVKATSTRNGKFRMMVNPHNQLGLPVASFDNAKAILTMAKKMGAVTGGGAKRYLPKSDGTLYEFRTDDRAAKWLRENPDEERALARLLVMMQREDKGLAALPPDGYLFDWCAVE